MAQLSERALMCRDECAVWSPAKRGNALCKALASVCRLVGPNCKPCERETGKRCTDPIVQLVGM